MEPEVVTTRAQSVLAGRVEEAATRLLKAARPGQRVIYTGNRHGAIPVRLITDPVLEPVDKLSWIVISTQVGKDGIFGTIPSYKEIARLANVGSSSTVARALAILRATRWLTLCRQVRDSGGRFRRNVYAMHDEPAPLSECLELDPDYFDFLEEACGHGHARVRAVATALRASIEEDVRTCRHARKPPTAAERRLEAARTTGEAPGERYFALSGTAIARLNDQRANSRYPDRLRNSNTVRSSSNNKTTTTTTSVTSEINVDLVFPCHLNRAHRTLALKYLDKVPVAERQAVLDELEGRIQAEKRGARPLWDVMGYLARLCERACTGEFNPNLGIPVAEARQKLARPPEQSAVPDPSGPPPLDREKAREQIQRLREIVGRSRPK
jgi:hypothetical protein